VAEHGLAVVMLQVLVQAHTGTALAEDAVGTLLLTRNGYDWAQKYSLIVEAVNHLRVRSCLIDGEAAAATRTGLLCSRRCAGGERTRGCVYAFDLLELDGKDVRREPYEVRKATLASVLRQGRPGLRINEHLDYPGDMVFRHACSSKASYLSVWARTIAAAGPGIG